jgi:Winged helix domain, variant/ATPase family associated with various cellular activities (AAA)
MTAELTEGTASRLLGRLDQMLRAAVERMLATLGPDAAADPFRGLYISRDDAARLLDAWPGQPPVSGDLAEGGDGEGDVGPELAWVAGAYGLSDFDLHVVLLALAPEVDLRYERVYAFLQDDVSRRRPTVDLALNLLCATPETRLRRRWHFTEEGPLVRNDIVRLVADPGSAEPPLLAHALKLDERIVRRLLGYCGLDPVLRGICGILEQPGSALDVPVLEDQLDALVALVRQADLSSEPLCLYLSGPPGWAKRRLAAAVAVGADLPLLTVSLGDALATGLSFGPLMHRVHDEARIQQAIVYAEPLDALLGAADPQPLVDVVTGYPGVTILVGTPARPPAGLGARTLVSVHVPPPTHEQRAEYWRACLAAAGEPVTEPAVQELAGRFRLAPEQIADAVAMARSGAGLGPAAAGGDGLALRELFAAARAQSDPALDGLARKIQPMHDWTQIVLPQDTLAQLHEMCEQVVHRHQVLDEWGFGHRLSVGKGVTALFAGPPGTGKTMAADVIARELGLDLYKIDLSGVVSKYIGETEKNLAALFTAAESGAVLLFDEGDALFGKRTQVRDSRDRYANLEISYLLQRLETFRGIAIVTTNVREAVDTAFTRRMRFLVTFGFPDAGQRATLWRRAFPPGGPTTGLDPARLAQLAVGGGTIAQLAMHAAFLAADAGEPVRMGHVLEAARIECAKLERPLSAQETRGWS